MADHDTIDEVKPEVPTGLEYDRPPPQWVPGTVVPQDTAPEDMTDAEYIQWCFNNRMPYWAIKKNVRLRVLPVLTSIEPSTAAIGDPGFTLYIKGEGFCSDSVIVFAGQDEPTRLDEEMTTVSTGVNMDVWHGADTLEVRVRNGDQVSEPLAFTFTAAAAPPADEPEPDAYDDQDDDDGKPAKKAKRKK
jgi:hypothetical protein